MFFVFRACHKTIEQEESAKKKKTKKNKKDRSNKKKKLTPKQQEAKEVKEAEQKKARRAERERCAEPHDSRRRSEGQTETHIVFHPTNILTVSPTPGLEQGEQRFSGGCDQGHRPERQDAKASVLWLAGIKLCWCLKV